MKKIFKNIILFVILVIFTFTLTAYFPANVNNIKASISLQNPDDGEWWEKDDLLEEDTFATYATAKGTFKAQSDKPISGDKMLLASDTKSYTARTKSNGSFDFGTIVTGYYELFVVNGSNKIPTGYAAYIAQDDIVTFNVVTDTSGVANDSLGGDYNFDSDSAEGATSSFTGTVYTIQLDMLPELKVLLKNGDTVVGEVVTDKMGTFSFANIPVGTYQLYAVNKDGTEYLFRDIDIEEGIQRTIKLKYDAPSQTGSTDMGWLTWVIGVAFPFVIIILVLASGIFLIIFFSIRKKRRKAQKSTTPQMQQSSSIDELKKFKELLDNGIITQEEFDKKKKQLLDL